MTAACARFGRRDDRVPRRFGFEHAGERVVHDRFGAAGQRGGEGRQLVRELVLDQLVDRDRIEHLVREEPGECVDDLGFEQRLLGGAGHRARIEQRPVRGQGDDARQHADDSEDAEDQ